MNFINYIFNFLGSHWEAIVAICALFITTWQTTVTRRHNRLSVKPHLVTWVNDHKDDEWFTITVELMNNGLGPALINSFKVFYEGKEIGTNENRQALDVKIKSIFEEQKGVLKLHFAILGKDFSFPSAQRKALLSISTPIHMGFDKIPYQEFVDKFDLEIEYRSMYGNKFTFCSKDD